MRIQKVATLAVVAQAAVIMTASLVVAQESPAPAESPPPAMSEAPAASGSPAASMAAGTLVPVTVQEVSVVPSMTSIPAGAVTLEVMNAGPALAHELVVVRTDIPAAELPTLEDGSFDEAAEGVEVLGEVEPFDPGLTESLALDLTAGHYVFLCNVVAEVDGAPFSHYQQGMFADVEVVDAIAAESIAPASPAASMVPAPSAPAASPAA